MIRMINLSIKRFAIDSELLKSDAIGAIASGLCILHCLATPIFFIASACSLSCCNNTPLWWQWMDYVFLGISFFAIKYATKSSSKDWVVQGLWVAWVTLFIAILNIKMEWIYLAENIKFIPAFALVGLHMYNMRYCQCEKECC